MSVSYLMKKIIQTYRSINILSLDIVAGAVICALFFAKVFEVTVLPHGLISLGLTVWIIYTADHLLDAKKVQQPASTERHRFHQKHFKVLLAVAIVAAVIDVVQLFFIRTKVFETGLALSAAVIIYFFLQRYLHFLKEIAGALLYAGGVLLIPLSMVKSISAQQSVLVIQFILTALINLVMFSWIDKSHDEKDKHGSFATVMGEKTTKLFLTTLFIVQVIVITVQFQISNFRLEFVIALMNAILFLIFYRRKYFEISDRYRLLGDGIFLLPLIYLLWN